MYSFSVSATDNPSSPPSSSSSSALTSAASVEVLVSDANDHPPRFSAHHRTAEAARELAASGLVQEGEVVPVYEAEVSLSDYDEYGEGEAVEVARVEATDPDSGANGEVFYRYKKICPPQKKL